MPLRRPRFSHNLDFGHRTEAHARRALLTGVLLPGRYLLFQAPFHARAAEEGHEDTAVALLPVLD